MYAAITHVDKQSFPFSDVLRACFYEIANHAKINGAKGVSLIAGNIFCKTVQMHSVFSSACSYVMSAVHLSKEDTTRGRIRRSTHLHGHWWSNVQCVYNLLS